MTTIDSGLAALRLQTRITAPQLGAAVIGVVGVALLVLRSNAALGVAGAAR